MELDAEELSLIEHFREQAADKRRAKLEAEIMQQDHDEQQHKDERRKREEKEKKEQEELVRATAAQVEAFTHQLDDYDTATVHALMINQEKLDAVRLQLDRTEAAAFRLPDGRAVFRTADGQRVLDKSGAEVSRDEVHPGEISADTPTWEVWQGYKSVERDLLKQRDDIHSFQNRLDHAREQSSQAGVSADTLAKMDADLKASMPQAVRDASQHPGDASNDLRTKREAAQTLRPLDRAASAQVVMPSPM